MVIALPPQPLLVLLEPKLLLPKPREPLIKERVLQTAINLPKKVHITQIGILLVVLATVALVLVWTNASVVLLVISQLVSLNSVY